MTMVATKSPTLNDIHRAAAWWAGEGCVSSKGGRLSVHVAQKEVAVLYWLQERFGGSVYLRRTAPGRVNDWAAHGSRARGFLQTIYSCIPESPRRQKQIYDALIATMPIKKTGVPASIYCRKGHLRRALGMECLLCQRNVQRAWRALPKNAEVHRRKERERYARKVSQ